MKVANTASITATFASAVLSLILPTSAMSADEGLRSDSAPASIRRPRDEHGPTDAVSSDPILESKWGPGDPSLTARQFHFTLPSLRERDPSSPDRAPSPPDRDPSNPRQATSRGNAP
jgi:hypothetical protein